MRILFPILLCFFCINGRGQKLGYIFNKLTTENGLPSNYILSEYQDTKGFLWIGTANGLVRFDGKRFYNDIKLNTTELDAQPVKQIVGDQEGNIWLKVGETFGIFNPLTLHFTKIKIENPTEYNHDSNLYSDGIGNIFIIFRGNIIQKYDRKINAFTQKLAFSIPTGWTFNSIFYDKKTSNYWLCGTKGILVYSNKLKRFLSSSDFNVGMPLLNNKRFYNVIKVFIDLHRNIWVVYWTDKLSSTQLLVCYNDSLKTINEENSKIVFSNSGYRVIDQIFESDNGDLWLYGSDVMALYNKGRQKFYNINSSTTTKTNVNYSQVNQIIEDREHNIWIATDAGWYSCSPERPIVKNYFLSRQDGENYLNGATSVEGQLWMSSWNKGIIKIDSNLENVVPEHFLDHNNYDKNLSWALCLSSRTHKIYTACQHGWLRVDISKHKPQFYHLPIFNSKTIRDVVEDHNGQLLFATQEGRIILFDPETELSNEHFKEIQMLGLIVNRLYIDSNNRLWACTNKGLYCIEINSGEIKHIYSADGDSGKSLMDFNVTDIAQINDSIFGIAANNFHLLNIKNDSIVRLTYYNGVSSNKVTCITADHHSNLWLTTPNGITRYNYFNNRFTRYTEKDGFIFSEGFGEKSSLQRDGTIVTVGGNQVSTFRPDEFIPKQPPPKVIITEIKVVNHSIGLEFLTSGQGIELLPSENSLSINFSTLNYFQNDKLTYLYKLKGAGSWQIADNSQSINYTLLPSKYYVFQVKCLDQDGTSSPITELNFHIQTPFYFRWWFIFLCILFIATDIYFISRSKRNKRKAIEKMRATVARDLHDDMGSTLSTINILSSMAKNRLSVDPAKTALYIEKISDNSQRMMEAMDDIVWSIKPSNDSMTKIGGRMREFSTNVLEAKNIDIEFKIDEEVNDIRLNMASRRDLFLLFKEAVNNLAKYSNATKALIHLGYNKRQLIMIIKDNGEGFDIKNSDNGNGISNMRKRAASLKGRLEIESKEHVGTMITLTLNV